MISSERTGRQADAPDLSRDFTDRVLARLDAADASRQRRRRLAVLSRPAFAVLLGILSALAGLTALPAYGADGTRVAVRAVSWLVVGQSVSKNVGDSLLSELGLFWLPVATALLVLGTVGLGAERHMRRGRLTGGVTLQAVSPDTSSALPSIDGRNALVSLLAFVVLAAALVPAMAYGRGSVHIGDLRIGAADATGQTMLVFAGDAVIEGRAAAPLVVLGGDIRLSGSATDDLVSVGGSVMLASDSVVGRDVVALGGRVLRADGATVRGNVAGHELRWTGSEIRSELDLLGALLSRVRLALLGAASGMLAAIAAVTLVPWLVVLTAATGRGAPVHSGLLGLAGIACGPLVILPLALSLVGAPLAGILALALVLCWWLGAVSASFLLGRRLLGLFRHESSLIRAALLGGGLLGALVGLPVIGGMILALVGAAGAGAVLLALIEGEFGSARAPGSTVEMMVYD